MSREVDKYSVVQTRADGVRERIQLLPAGNIVAGEVDFPPFCVMGITGGGAAFEKYPSGMIKYDERTIKFHLDYMFAADPVVTDYILAPTYENFVNVWTISDDGGNSEMDLEDFIVRFRGVQIAQPSEKYSKLASGLTHMTVKILHVARYLAENAVPEQIAAAMISQSDEAFAFATVGMTNLYDIIYQSGASRVYIMDSGRLRKESGLGIPNQVAIMFKLSSLFVAVTRWMEKRYRVIMHVDTLSLEWADDFAPHHTTTFYEPNLSAGTPGISVIDNLSGIAVGEIGVGTHSQLWFCGLIGEQGWYFVDDGPGEFPPAGKVILIGGYLKDADKFCAYKSIQDWLMDICTNFACKLTYEITPTGDVEFAARKVRQGTPIALSTTDFIREEKPFERNTDRIRGCDAQVDAAGSNDISQVEYFKDSNSENRPEGNVKCLFNNLPSTDDLPSGNWNDRRYDTPYFAPEIADAKYTYPLYGTSYPLIVAKRDGYRTNVLYCNIYNTDFFQAGSATQFVRVHRSVVVSDGISDYENAPEIALPALLFDDKAASTKLVQGYATTVQRIDGLPFAICKANTAMYGESTMIYEGTADQGVIMPSDVGRLYDVSEFIHPALEGKTSEVAVLRKATENRDANNNLLPTSVELFAF